MGRFKFAWKDLTQCPQYFICVIYYAQRPSKNNLRVRDPIQSCLVPDLSCSHLFKTDQDLWQEAKKEAIKFLEEKILPAASKLLHPEMEK